MDRAYLALADGNIYEGFAMGARRETVGELVFTTGMCGYIETLTDPSYYGQIVMQTFPLIGNYGVISEDFEGKNALFGYVVREKCDDPSNFRCEKTLDDFLKERDIPGVYGVDTREITRNLREYGVMNACICYDRRKAESLYADKDSKDNPLFGFKIKDAVRSLCCTDKKDFSPAGEFRYRVALLDYGAKRNIIRELNKRGVLVTETPADTAAEEILSGGYDGVMLSNGPGDPEENVYAIEQIRKLLGNIPLFGICLGHQLTALAAGAKTYKLKYGHRGVNQPVKDLKSGRTFITTQNHGYAVDSSTVPECAKLSFVNANDGTCEGLTYNNLDCFTVQFHPEACGGPGDTMFLFDEFIKLMGRGV
ncbi:MAG: carbamoyl phosphate synthase small subunit [Clostridia bacterium]|nr:carbamoyl phosphate synthase small subunit [Clostridia bacterium]